MIYATDSGAEFRVIVEPVAPSRASGRTRGMRVGLSAYRHPGPYLVPPGSTAPVKWLARGPLAHALREARRLGWEEAILEDAEGRLIEGTRSNLLAVVGGVLVSPGPESFALPGITREVVLEEAHRAGLRVEERGLRRAELPHTSEVMLTSSLMGLASVATVDGLWAGRRSPCGPVAAALRGAYRDRVRAKG
jgi:branched-subunit amino acid aminotransferase/4-amino-4-deoxychorismate lyase